MTEQPREARTCASHTFIWRRLFELRVRQDTSAVQAHPYVPGAGQQTIGSYSIECTLCYFWPHSGRRKWTAALVVVMPSYRCFRFRSSWFKLLRQSIARQPACTSARVNSAVMIVVTHTHSHEWRFRPPLFWRQLNWIEFELIELTPDGHKLVARVFRLPRQAQYLDRHWIVVNYITELWELLTLAWYFRVFWPL